MRKIFVIASREYQAAVRTKSFLISLVVLPVMMGGGAIFQMLLKDVRDTREKRFAIIDRSPGKELGPLLESKAASRKIEDESGKKINPVFVIELKEPNANTREALSELRFELSERVRHKELFGFVDIGPDIYEATTGLAESPGKTRGEAPLRYQTNSPTYDAFPGWLAGVISDAVQEKRTRDLVTRLGDTVQDQRTKELIARNLTVDQLNLTLQRVSPVTKGLSIRTATGTIEDGPDDNKIAAILVPLGLMILMFMMVLVGATPLMQGVVEEKMQRIAEVLLGSVQPFQLMMGKLLGMTAVSLTLATIYLSAAYAAAVHFEFTKHISIDLLLWFVLFQVLATMMFGSLFIAVGAACSDLRETQNLLWPVMLLAVFPMFVLMPIVTEPNSPFAITASFFPFATPTLMIARLAVPPSIPYWQPMLGAVIVLLSTVGCVYVAGRIFRVGLLLQGKGAKLSDLFRWVIRG